MIVAYIVLDVVLFQSVGMANLKDAVQKPKVMISMYALGLILMTYASVVTAVG